MHNEKYIIGYTTTDYLLLDLDNTTFNKVCGLVKIMQKDFKLGDCLISCSSDKVKKSFIENCLEKQTQGNYHCIFNNKIGYERICQIVNILSDLSILEPDYKLIREWRGDITLRVSPDNSKEAFRDIPKPIIILDSFNDNNDDGIQYYLNCLMVVNA